MMKCILRVFHIDDDEDYLYLFSHYFKRYCPFAEIESYSNVHSFFNSINEKNDEYDLFIIDYDLGNITGFEVIQQLRTKFCNSIFVLVSSVGNKNIVKELVKYDIDFYMHKSASIEYIAYHLSRICKLYIEIKRLKLQAEY